MPRFCTRPASHRASTRSRAVRLPSGRAGAHRLLRPPPVRLASRAPPLRAAVAALRRRTGLGVRFTGAGSRKVTLDTGDTALWEALARFCGKAGLTDYPAA